mmetsp:Transcript_63021/g.173087  ORF Transcript_63021/g.173087 Transcript_63021/m.173087 type:complete len:444 (+) Transcript_63021:8-1339(+)
MPPARALCPCGMDPERVRGVTRLTTVRHASYRRVRRTEPRRDGRGSAAQPAALASTAKANSVAREQSPPKPPTEADRALHASSPPSAVRSRARCAGRARASAQVEELLDLLAALARREVVGLEELLGLGLLETLELEDLAEVGLEAARAHLADGRFEKLLRRLHELEHLLGLAHLVRDEPVVRRGGGRLAERGQVEQRLLECADVQLHLLRAHLAYPLAPVDAADEARHEVGDELGAEEGDVLAAQVLAELRHHLARGGHDALHVRGGVLANVVEAVPLDRDHRLEARRHTRLERRHQHLHAAVDESVEVVLHGGEVDGGAQLLGGDGLGDRVAEALGGVRAVLGRVDHRADDALCGVVDGALGRVGGVGGLLDARELLEQLLGVELEVLRPRLVQEVEEDGAHVERGRALVLPLEGEEELLGRVEHARVGASGGVDGPRLVR